MIDPLLRNALLFGALALAAVLLGGGWMGGAVHRWRWATASVLAVGGVGAGLALRVLDPRPWYWGAPWEQALALALWVVVARGVARHGLPLAGPVVVVAPALGFLAGDLGAALLLARVEPRLRGRAVTLAVAGALLSPLGTPATLVLGPVSPWVAAGLALAGLGGGRLALDGDRRLVPALALAVALCLALPAARLPALAALAAGLVATGGGVPWRDLVWVGAVAVLAGVATSAGAVMAVIEALQSLAAVLPEASLAAGAAAGAVLALAGGEVAAALLVAALLGLGVTADPRWLQVLAVGVAVGSGRPWRVAGVWPTRQAAAVAAAAAWSAWVLLD